MGTTAIFIVSTPYIRPNEMSEDAKMNVSIMTEWGKHGIRWASGAYYRDGDPTPKSIMWQQTENHIYHNYIITQYGVTNHDFWVILERGVNYS